jgi:hypothetical protein
MKINIIAPFRYPDTSMEIFYKEGLEELGHNVITPPRLANDADISIAIKYCERPDLLPGVKVLIYTDNYDRDRKYLDELAKQKVYDYIFLPNLDPEIDNETFFWVPCSYSPKRHHPLPVEKRTIPCLFIGTRHENRDWISASPKSLIRIYGNGWGDSIRPFYGAEKMEMHAKSCMILNHHYNRYGANMRFYETLATRRLMLCDEIIGAKEMGFKAGEHYIEYANPMDLVEKIQYYLDNPDERDKIANSGFKAVQGHTYKARMEKMLEVIENGK